MLQGKRRKKYSKRSLNGCRTCRIRHVKCDEHPVICNNCKSTGRKCDGYDMHRLPANKRALTSTLNIFTHPGRVTTMDEQRCFAYFQHCSIPGLGVFFDSPLWQKIVLKISHVDPAVYHAANMLGALHEDSNANKMRVSGENLRQARHRFALQQASRAYTHLSQRRTSKDPEFREVMLVCCLLFVLSELLLGRYEKAFQHLHSGLKILKESQECHRNFSLDDSLVRIFRRLDVESAHFGSGTPFLFKYSGIGSDPSLSGQGPFSNMVKVTDVHRSVTILLNLGIPFLARCWPISASQVASEYKELFLNQHMILSLNLQFQSHFEIFLRDIYHTLSSRDQQSVDVLQLQSLSQILSLKTCLIKGSIPDTFTAEYLNLLLAHRGFLAKFSGRSTFTLDYGVLPGLWVVASECPNYSIRLQAIQTLHSWPHCEGIINSNVVVSMALRKLRRELGICGQPNSSIMDANTEEELSQYLVNMMSAQQAMNWSFIRGAEIFIK
ncbi:hypothetical protein PENSTE_c025G01934 [Penicillium steckii]|uniref:Zn(2)-C6 fungal-type domain-containing protein n=1 Tax=Penicillium steckii TaxID=303698 RepID=A0A1V6SQM7_9EURO|nr:hypothetical protein PENSTE_c025G01934 [Penicillium steckii]